MKKILGLDLGTNSIGWAVVNEAENDNEISSIVKLGVRTIHYDNFVNSESGKECLEPEKDFRGGKSISCNAGRTKARSARRNLQRYKLRRANLIEILKANNFITDDTILSENGNKTTFETYRIRAKAATEKISLNDFSRVLLMINKKRGYKSSRKAKSTDEGQLIDGMNVSIQMYERGLTPGQFSLELLKSGKKYIPDYYRSDLQNEFDKIWQIQKQYYSFLTDELKKKLIDKNKSQTWTICAKPFNIVGIKRTSKGLEQKKENYQWRNDALYGKIGLEELAIVFQDINSQLNNSSGYLGEISDRSKELFFSKQTVGQFLMKELDRNPNFSLKNKVFFRQDYLDEFEKIWETQAKYYKKELNETLKKEIRDVIIFYQRPLKSQKELISLCEFENREIEINIDGIKKTKHIGMRVCPKSSPLFQEFKIWQILNNIVVSDINNNKRQLYIEEKEALFYELSYKEKLSKSDVLKFLFKNDKNLDINYQIIEGNRTQAILFNAYQTIINNSGHGEFDFSKMKSKDSVQIVKDVFSSIGINTNILTFDSSLKGQDIEKQPMFQLWHLLYSFEGDSSKIGNEKLIEKISSLYGFEKEYASILANVVFQSDYGNLSTKAIRKILPHLKDGLEYSVACEYAGYCHSKKSLTKEELKNKVYKNHLDLIPQNSLRNPVVEKILNQMVNVVNTVIDTYGKPDEIRIELARDLKKSVKERKETTDLITKTTALHDDYKKILQSEFGIEHVSRNDIIRYKLYLELKDNGFKTLYTNTYIPQEKLFSKEFDIEHIIPQAKLFDDSFSNKTLEARQANIEKSNTTAFEYVKTKGEPELSKYIERIEKLFNNKSISKTKRDKLLMEESNIPSGFIERDLRDSQYIAKKAREILEEIVPFVVPTIGSITDRLREDWQLVNIMQELNWNKYEKQGLTEYYQDKDGRKIGVIKDWSKRNDNRHHAMDALTIAFTKRNIIQYLNNLNSRVDKSIDEYIDLDMVEFHDLPKEKRILAVRTIEKKELHRDSHGKLRFNSPMPLDKFRKEVKLQLENILISNKVRTKVVTKNINISKSKNGLNKNLQLTPRGSLHNETIYGSHMKYITSIEKVGSSFSKEKIMTVANKKFREALLTRLSEFEGDPQKAFSGKNSINKNPIYVDSQHKITVPEKLKIVKKEIVYTIRKPITPELKLDKIIDVGIKTILEKRLKEFNGDSKKAFSNLEENPIWLNKEKGISIKRVTISGISNAISLHDKKDRNGNFILDKNGNCQPVDFVNTGNNHHVAIYRNENGELQENVVSFFEAVERARQGLPIIDKYYKKEEGWTFLFSMKQNEYFVFPNKETGFNPHEIDLMNPDNYSLISPNLFRVQTMSKVSYGNSIIRDYKFRHHLETLVVDNKLLKDITYKQYKTLDFAENIVKVRINHIGHIVAVGEY